MPRLVPLGRYRRDSPLVHLQVSRLPGTLQAATAGLEAGLRGQIDVPGHLPALAADVALAPRRSDPEFSCSEKPA